MPLITGASGRRYFVTQEAQDVHAVRFLRPSRFDYDQAIVVHVQDGGRALFLSLWLGGVPGAHAWRQAANDLYPDARAVSFKRCNPITGQVRHVTIPLREEIPRED